MKHCANCNSTRNVEEKWFQGNADKWTWQWFLGRSKIWSKLMCKDCVDNMLNAMRELSKNLKKIIKEEESK